MQIELNCQMSPLIKACFCISYFARLKVFHANLFGDSRKVTFSMNQNKAKLLQTVFVAAENRSGRRSKHVHAFLMSVVF